MAEDALGDGWCVTDAELAPAEAELTVVTGCRRFGVPVVEE